MWICVPNSSQVRQVQKTSLRVAESIMWDYVHISRVADTWQIHKKCWFLDFRLWDLKLAFYHHQYKKAEEAFTSWNAYSEGWIGMRWEIKGEAKEHTEIFVSVTGSHWEETLEYPFIHPWGIALMLSPRIENYHVIFHQYHLLVLAQSVQESLWHLWSSTGPKLSPWRHLVWSGDIFDIKGWC